MKKIFALALALVAFEASVNAQDSEMSINRANNASIVYDLGKVENVVFEDSQWTSLGYCLYGEDFVASVFAPSGGSMGDFCCQYYVEVQEKNDQPGLYRLVNPYGTSYPFLSNGSFSTDERKDYYLEIDATDPDAVFINLQESGLFVSSYGDFGVYSYAALMMDYYGYSLDQVKAEGWCGKLSDGKITFPEDMLLSTLSCSTYLGYGLPGNYFNNFLLDLNDVDNSAGPNNVAMQSEMMKINRTYGVSEFMIGSVKKVKHYDSPWVSLGYCLYGEDFIGSAFIRNGQGGGYYCCEYYVEVQENTEQPGLYRLVNPYSPNVYPITDYGTYDDTMDYYIEIDATDPDAVFITRQDTGIDWDTYGHIWVYSTAGYGYDYNYSKSEIAERGYFGTMKDGVITFPQNTLLTILRSYYPTSYLTGNVYNNFKLDLNDKSNVAGPKMTKCLKAECEEITEDFVTIEEEATLGVVLHYSNDATQKIFTK